MKTDPKMVKFGGKVVLHYQPEFAIEEPDWGKDLLKDAARAMREQLVKAIDTLDQKMVEACIQAAQEEGVCLTLIDKKFIADAIREKMEREGLMDEHK